MFTGPIFMGFIRVGKSNITKIHLPNGHYVVGRPAYNKSYDNNDRHF